MELEEKHIDYITNSLKFHGIKQESLRDDLVDHICTYIENQDSKNFEQLYQEALHKFGGYSSFKDLQLETKLQTYTNQKIMLNKIKIVLGSFMVLLLVFGSLFKIMHWPYASSLIVLSILVFAFGLLPIFVYAKFKKSRYQFS